MSTYDLDGVRHLVFVCLGSDCRDAGAEDALCELKAAKKELGLRERVHVVRTRCMGRCADGPNVIVTPGCWYGGVTARAARRIAVEHLAATHPVEELRTHVLGDGGISRVAGKRGKPKK